MRDLEDGGADPEAIADADLGVGESFDGEVLAELPVHEVVAPELPVRDAPLSRATVATVFVPRPLKLLTGSSVSTFSVTEHPSARPSGAHGSAGVSRNAGSISPTAARTRSSRSRTRSSQSRPAACQPAGSWLAATYPALDARRDGQVAASRSRRVLLRLPGAARYMSRPSVAMRAWEQERSAPRADVLRTIVCGG